MFTIRPQRASTMSGRKARVQRKVPRRFTASIRSHTSSLIWRRGTKFAMPASLTRMCTRPSSVCTRPAAAWTLGALATSVATAIARRPSLRTSSATATAPGSSRSRIATSAPSRARRRQMLRPIPDAPPVTTAFLPARLMTGAGDPRCSCARVSLQPPSHADALLDAEAEALVKGHHVAVGAEDLEVQLGAAEGTQPGLHLRDHPLADAAAAVLGCDGEFVEPTPVAVVAAHRRGDHRVVDLADQEEVALQGELPAYLVARIAPVGAERARPQREHR